MVSWECLNLVQGFIIYHNGAARLVRLRDVPQHTGYKLLWIEDDVCVFESAADHEVHKVPYELAVLSMGQRPAADPVEEYSGFDNLHVIGANKKFGPVAIAVEDAYLVAYSLQ